MGGTQGPARNRENAVKYLGVAAGDILAGYTLSGTLQGMGTLGDIMQRKAGDIEYNTERVNTNLSIQEAGQSRSTKGLRLR